MIQSDLLTWTPPDTDRFGETYSHSFDYDRLNRQQRLVWEVVKDGRWHSLHDIGARTGAPEASISSRLRDFRNMFGWTVERRRIAGGLYQYRVCAP